MLGGDGSLFPRLQVCFALILCFISQKGGLSWRPDEMGPTAERDSSAQIHSPGPGPVTDRRGDSESLLGGRGRASGGV